MHEIDFHSQMEILLQIHDIRLFKAGTQSTYVLMDYFRWSSMQDGLCVMSEWLLDLCPSTPAYITHGTSALFFGKSRWLTCGDVCRNLPGELLAQIGWLLWTFFMRMSGYFSWIDTMRWDVSIRIIAMISELNDDGFIWITTIRHHDHHSPMNSTLIAILIMIF